MDPEGKNEDTDNKPGNSTPAPLPDKDKGKEVEKSKESPPAETTNCKEEKPGCSQISIVDKTPDKWHKANIISLVAAGINVVVVIAYAFLYSQGQRAAEETKREFETSNRPFIELSNIKIDSVKEGQKPIIFYSLTNKGRFPALVTRFKSYIGNATTKNTAEEIVKAADQSVLTGPDTTIGIIPFAPSTNQQSAQVADTFTLNQINDIASAQRFFTLTVEINYMNLVTKRHYFFIQVIKISPLPAFVPTSMKYNDDPQ